MMLNKKTSRHPKVTSRSSSVVEVVEPGLEAVTNETRGVKIIQCYPFARHSQEKFSAVLPHKHPVWRDTQRLYGREIVQ